QQLAFDAFAQDAVLDGEDHFDAAQKVSRHPVGAAQEDLRLAGVLEIADAAVFEEAVHDAAHRDVFTDTGNAGTQAANAAHDEVDLYSRLRGLIQRFNYLRIHQGVHFGDDARRQAVGRVLRFALDQGQDALAQVERRHDQLARALKLADAGEQVEQVG